MSVGRRNVLTGAAAAALAPAAGISAAATPIADAELLTLCARHQEIHRAIVAMNENRGAHEEEVAHLCDHHEEVGDRIAAIRPTTQAGMTAKLRATSDAWSLGMEPCDMGRVEFRMVEEALNNLLAGGGE